MSPEQFTDGAADARSDQFSFCAMLHEVVYGTRPFAGATLEIPEARGLDALSHQDEASSRRVGVERRPTDQLRRVTLCANRSTSRAAAFDR